VPAQLLVFFAKYVQRLLKAKTKVWSLGGRDKLQKH